MKNIFTLLCIFCCTLASAQANWFTVLGDRNDPAVNTIEVDPVPIAVGGSLRTMRVRVSRSLDRISWDGVPYRSYVSEVVVDCASRTARYSALNFYRQPLWAGESHNTSVYTKANPRAMQFLDVSPNPTARIIRAACETGNVQVN
ncbi:surface-adhesin E family protein [Polaromonas sp. A23]|uniref:surface-adhesin E family protein n=1 Tax=Polaromonas sp. A23 TaxID=1944133 RepID=UPI0009850443|nr:surface-adhesin E family protein [Polaromonas sp. A23]OOG39454.1 hypothetical protein B0B52_15700 [Polaromonas sp. A23]